MTVHPHPSRLLPCRPPLTCLAEAEAAVSIAKTRLQWERDGYGSGKHPMTVRDVLVLAGAAIAEALAGMEPVSSGAVVAAEADE